ncbi:MAG: hypothetical protein EB037_12130, partial [Actinobacteria bacterium]|nr:hypothetical protein [Actinomycetota bacterium]
MFATDICTLPTTGNNDVAIVAALAVLVSGVIATRWLKASRRQLSVIAVVPALLVGMLALSPDSTDCVTPSTSAPTTTLPAPSPVQIAECVTALSPWVATINDYSQQAQTKDSFALVTYYAQRAAAEVSVCSGFNLIQNGTADSPDAGAIFGVGYSYTSYHGACVSGPCDGGDGGA